MQFAEAAEADMACKKCHGMRFMGTILGKKMEIIVLLKIDETNLIFSIPSFLKFQILSF